MMQMLHVMTRHPETIRPSDMLLKAKEMMDAGGFRRLPVVHEGRIVGILTERDLREHVGYLESTKVDAAMKTPVALLNRKRRSKRQPDRCWQTRLVDCRSLTMAN